MIYDKPLDIFALPENIAVPTAANLRLVSQHWCAEKTVYQNRYWQSVQAGSSVDRMVEVPQYLGDVDAAMFAMFGGKMYSIEQVQYAQDANGLDVTVLSLKRYLGNLDKEAGA